jgi:DNA (cytosine-5)-methyltransferase 1
MKILDLYCGAGGAAERCKAQGALHSSGYARAAQALGIHPEITGVDIRPMPHYPGELRLRSHPQQHSEFILGDALQYLADYGKLYDFIHASPPCQRYVTLQSMNRKHGKRVNHHPDLIGPTRAGLQSTGKPYVIENVIGAPLQTQAILCGHELGLVHLARHRCFESNRVIFGTPCSHRKAERIVGVYGSRPDGRSVVAKKEYRVTRTARGLAEAQAVMGIDWMTWEEIKEAVPPAYTEFIGKQIFQNLDVT